MSQFNAAGYDIQRPTGVCAFTGRKLEPGEQYIATLIEFEESTTQAGAEPTPEKPEGKPEGKPAAEKPAAERTSPRPTAGKLGFKRLDVSLEAWKQGKRPEQMFSYWKSTVAHPNQKKKVFVDDEVLMTLFRRLADETQPQRQAFRFVLALILLRKKLLRFEGQSEKTVQITQPDGSVQTVTQEWWDMVPKAEDTALPVLNPQMNEEQIVEVTTQLGEVLEGSV